MTLRFRFRIQRQERNPRRCPNAIEVSHIVKKYGDFTAVDDVSFEVKEGEIFVCWARTARGGKSTLIRMMTTLIPITAGSARSRARREQRTGRGARGYRVILRR